MTKIVAMHVKKAYLVYDHANDGTALGGVEVYGKVPGSRKNSRLSVHPIHKAMVFCPAYGTGRGKAVVSPEDWKRIVNAATPTYGVNGPRDKKPSAAEAAALRKQMLDFVDVAAVVNDPAYPHTADDKKEHVYTTVIFD